MTHKHASTFVNCMLAVFGFGGVQVGVHWQQEVLKFILSMLTAILAGGLGWLGQEIAKKLYSKYKKQKT